MIKTWSERKSLNFNKYLALHLVEMVFLYCRFLQVWKSIWHGLDLGSKDKTLFRKVQKGSLAIVWCAIVNRNWKCFITYVVLGRLSMHPADFGFILTRKSKLLRYCEIAGYCCHSIVWIWVWLKLRIPSLASYAGILLACHATILPGEWGGRSPDVDRCCLSGQGNSNATETCSVRVKGWVAGEFPVNFSYLRVFIA